jgi:hypothetical protein
VNGGFYTFGGSWSDQENKGINFLTSYTATNESVSRLKTAHVSSNSIFLLFEIWTASDYVKTRVMEVDGSGAITQQPFDLSYAFQLPFADELVLKQGKIIAYSGSDLGQLIRYEMCLGSSCSSGDSSGASCGNTATATTAAAVEGTTGSAGLEATTTTAVGTAGAATSLPVSSDTTGIATTISTSVGVATTTASVASVSNSILSGTMNMDVADGTAFLNDTVAQTAVQEGIAQLAGVPTNLIALIFALLRRLMVPNGGLNGDGRRLLSSVQISYTISVPAGAGLDASAVQNNIASKSESQLTTVIQQKVQAVKGQNYSVAISAKSVVSVSQQVVTTTAVDNTLEHTSAAVGAFIGIMLWIGVALPIVALT